MESIDELLRQAEAAHVHLCAGQVLGVRMALLGLSRLEIADPRGADRDDRKGNGCRAIAFFARALAAEAARRLRYLTAAYRASVIFLAVS